LGWNSARAHAEGVRGGAARCSKSGARCWMWCEGSETLAVPFCCHCCPERSAILLSPPHAPKARLCSEQGWGFPMPIEPWVMASGCSTHPTLTKTAAAPCAGILGTLTGAGLPEPGLGESRAWLALQEGPRGHLQGSSSGPSTQDSHPARWHPAQASQAPASCQQ